MLSFPTRRGLVAAAILSLAVAAPAIAMSDDAMMAKMNAGPMAPAMSAMHDAMTAHPLNGNADHDFAIVMLATAKARAAAIKAELAKGKNADAKAMAAKMQADTAAQIEMLNGVIKGLGN